MKTLYLTEDNVYNYVFIVDNEKEKGALIDIDCSEYDIQKIIDNKNKICNEDLEWLSIEECFSNTFNTRILAYITDEKRKEIQK